MFQKILVPVDLSEDRLTAMAASKVIEFVKKTQDADHLCHVRFVTVLSLLPVTLMDYVPADFNVEQEKAAIEDLTAFAAKIGLPASQVSTVVLTGGIYVQIIEEAKNWGADLIVIGSHRPAMSTYLLGSNATAVVRHAPCSVLVLR